MSTCLITYKDENPVQFLFCKSHTFHQKYSVNFIEEKKAQFCPKQIDIFSYSLMAIEKKGLTSSILQDSKWALTITNNKI